MATLQGWLTTLRRHVVIPTERCMEAATYHTYDNNNTNTYIGNQRIYSDNIINYGSYKGHTIESNLRLTTMVYMGNTIFKLALLYYNGPKELYITGNLLLYIMAILDLRNGNTTIGSGPYIKYYGNKANTVYSEALYHDVMELLSDMDTGIYGSTIYATRDIHKGSNIDNAKDNTTDLLRAIRGKHTATYEGHTTGTMRAATQQSINGRDKYDYINKDQTSGKDYLTR